MEAKANPNTKRELLALYDLTAADVKRYIKFAIAEAQKKTALSSQNLRVGCSIMTTKSKTYNGQYIEDPTGSHITAEDFALHKALTEGDQEIKMMVVCYVENDHPVYRWPDGKWR